MRLVPGCLLLLIVIATLLQWNWNLAALEPFDAFSFRIAGVSAITIAIVWTRCVIPISDGVLQNMDAQQGLPLNLFGQGQVRRLGLRDIAGGWFVPLCDDCFCNF